MANKCSECETVIDLKECIECTVCENKYHPRCTRIKSLKNFRKLDKNVKLKNSWKCDQCITSISDNSDTVQEKNQECLVDSLKEFINERFAVFSEELAALTSSVNEIKESMKSLQTDNVNLKKECERLKLVNHECHREIRELQQRSRIDNLEIAGIPTTKGENVYEIIKCIAAVINVPFKDDDISIAHRVPTPKGKIQPIICKFTTRRTKLNWLLAAKVKRNLVTTDLNAGLPRGNIYINEHLTTANKLLLGKAKFLKRGGKLKFVWVKDGKILVRQTQDSPAKRIVKDEDLEPFE